MRRALALTLVLALALALCSTALLCSTGASAGIGEAAARHFALCGAHLILTARRVDKLEALAAALRAQHPALLVHVAALDVRDEGAHRTLLSALPPALAAIDVLVLNAGLARALQRVDDYAVGDVDEMLDTNVKGVLHGLRVFLPPMRARNRGHVLVVSSIAGKTAYAKGSVYCASKFAVEAIADATRAELADTALRVTKISPGAVAETEFSLVRFRGDAQTAQNVYKGYVPLVAADVADSIVYAASRPEHVQIQDIVLTPSAQASVAVLHRQQ